MAARATPPPSASLSFGFGRAVDMLSEKRTSTHDHTHAHTTPASHSAPSFHMPVSYMSGHSFSVGWLDPGMSDAMNLL